MQMKLFWQDIRKVEGITLQSNDINSGQTIVIKNNNGFLRFFKAIGTFFSHNGIIAAFLVLFILLTILSKDFFSWTNFTNIARSAVPTALIAFGMVFVVGMGEIDLSVGASMVFCSVVFASLVKGGSNIWLAMVLTVALGIFIGLINAALITKLRITPFIATLAIYRVLYGLNMVTTKNVPIYGLSFPEVQFLDQSKILTIPVSVLVCIAFGIICSILMYRMRFGRYVLSIGSNTEAARLVGINVHKIKFMVYGLVGLLVGVTSLIITSKMEAAVPDGMSGHELEVIAATVLGGTSMTGGKAKIWGAFVGALLMILVQNGMNMLAIIVFWQKAVVGIIILVAVGIDTLATYRHKT